MKDDEIIDCKKFVETLIWECGDILKNGIKDIGVISAKTDFYDLVTRYDEQVENILIDGIKRKYPSHCFIGEESSSNLKEVPSLTDLPTWIIDPIDGTVNFCKNLALSCISVAFLVNRETLFGIVYNPFTNEFYHAQRGKGAFLNEHAIHVSAVKDIRKALIAHEVSIGSKEAYRPKIIERTREYITKSLGIRCFGSAALTLCFVARGQIEAFTIEHLWPWDIAAGALIVQEAGGIVVNTYGGPYDVMNPDVIAVCNQEMGHEMLTIVREVDERIKNV